MITVLNFSNRAEGNCASAAKIINSHYNDRDVKIFDFGKLNIKPCGNCNYECFKGNNCCTDDDINLIYKAIIESELTIFIIPNYCDYPCSNFFIFNERGCGFFKQNKELLEKYSNVKKKFVVISNTNTQNFKEIFKYQIENQELSLLFLNAKKFNKNSLDGDLMEEVSAKNLLVSFLEDNYSLEESAMAIVFCGNKILATKESIYDKMTLSLPKGHIEESETHIEAAIRECFEETNIKLSKGDFIKEVTPFEVKFVDHNNMLVKKFIYPVVFKITDEGKPLAKEEQIKEVLFMDIDAFLGECTYDNVRVMVKGAILK